MSDIYLYMIAALAVLAVADLVVGVSNDAVNFLNSAIGSKAISFKTIMVVASIGIIIGAVFSSGMMEVARKGIFNPAEFVFSEIMIVFMAVMITDIILLDFFNTLGMPTSTTVSIVFELLGSAVAMAIYKINTGGGTFSDVLNYINTEQATLIITGIILSVMIAFTIGAVVQWLARLLLSYDFQKKPSWVGSLFGGIALTSLTYFIFMKGLQGTNYAKESFEIFNGATMNEFLENQALYIITISSVFWSLLSYILISVFKINIYKLIILVGTFALALAFAGNDLVNFIGVPIAAWQSYEAWILSGVPATEFSMIVLAQKVPTPTLMLLIAGVVMIITLWFSSKAKSVVKTSLDLSSQDNTKERFNPNFLSRSFVRAAVLTSDATAKILPQSWQAKIDRQFERPIEATIARKDAPAFDLVRASLNLMVAAVIISLATSYKLPLSTTYVTFMVAMGSSLADRAWGAESAVYRVAGVINVIGGWFFTAFVAFTAAGIIAILLNWNLIIMLPVLLVIAFSLIVRNYISHNEQAKVIKAENKVLKAESKNIQGITNESAHNIKSFMVRSSSIYTTIISGLATYDIKDLKKSRKGITKLNEEIDELRDNIFYFIKNLEDTSVSASNYYIAILSYLEDITQSLDYISKKSYKHVNNNHKKLRFNQIKDLKKVEEQVSQLLSDIKDIFETKNFDAIVKVLSKKESLLSDINAKIEKQVERTRTEESSPKNTTLYFGLLVETKDLIVGIMNLLDTYYRSSSYIKLSRNK